jgi:hypothetical protein
MFRAQTAESAGSSPSKPPEKRETDREPSKMHPFPNPQHNFGDAAGSEETLPNLGDSTAGTPNGAKWHIPAIRSDANNNSRPPILSHTRTAPPTGKPSAAAKTTRRDAVLKFNAYDGAVQICLEALMEGSNAADSATVFLTEGCRELKGALGLDPLLVHPGGRSGSRDAAVYWDDREEASLPAMELLVSPKLDPRLAVDEPPRDRKSGPHRPDKPADHDGIPNTKLNPSPLRGGTNVNNPSVSRSEGLSPCVETTVVRVVGCPLLDGPDGSKPGASRQRRQVTAALRPAGAPSSSGSRTLLSNNGATDRSPPLRLSTNAHHGTILIELLCNDEQVAAGTVQIAELCRVAVQSDALGAESPRAGGFLRGLVPHFGRRQERGGSMVWCRLVDADGSDAGHAVLAARVVPSEATFSSALDAAHDRVQRKTSLAPSAAVSTPPPPPSAPPESEPGVTSLAAGRQTQVATPDRLQAGEKKQMRDQQQGLVSASPAAQHATLVPRVDRRGGIGQQGTFSGPYLQINAQHVYDTLLEGALTANSCTSSSLVLHGPWSWLVQRYREKYGVRKQYATLAYLRFVVRRDVAVPTAACLQVLASELKPLMEQRESMALTSAELALLQHVLERVDDLLTLCFENYFSLSEHQPSGLIEGALSMRENDVPPALMPASTLLEMTRGLDNGPDGGLTWLAARVRAAARKRFHALLAATEARRGPAENRRAAVEFMTPGTVGGKDVDGGHVRRPVSETPNDDPVAAWAYARVEELCTCVTKELRFDEAIHQGALLPPGLRLPEVTAVEYVRGTISHLQRILQRHPPPEPTPPAVRLVEAVGRLQSYVERHRYRDAVARLNSRDIFGAFVAQWVRGSATRLRRVLRGLERAGPPSLGSWADMQAGVKHRVAPLVEGMLSEVEAEMKRYERIVGHWPVHAAELESALVGALRDSVEAVSRQCGLMQTKEESVDGGQRFGRVAWRWVQVGNGGADGHERRTNAAAAAAPAALRRGIAPHQALLLNSLRRLLAVTPQLEQSLKSWCAGQTLTSETMEGSEATFPPVGPSGAERVAREAPELGAHWAQLVKELRTEYVACVTLCVEALAGELAASSSTSVVGVLRREGLVAAPPAFNKHLRRVLDGTTPALRWLAAALDGRVFVALARGLWDLAARDILRYAENLTEGGQTSGAGATLSTGTGDHTSGGGGGINAMPVASGGAWRARQNSQMAVNALNTFYRAELGAAMGSDLMDRDMGPPQHAQRAAALLADNTVELNVSFDVY